MPIIMHETEENVTERQNYKFIKKTLKLNAWNWRKCDWKTKLINLLKHIKIKCMKLKKMWLKDKINWFIIKH